MTLNKQFQELFNNKTINQNRVDGAIKICVDTSISFAEWVVEKHKQYPDSVLRYDKLFDVYQKEKERKQQSMLPPKEKAEELFRKIGMLMDLKHSEILEVLDFLVETKIISTNIKPEELKYWESVREQAKTIK